MKISKVKLAVGALATAGVVSLVGSISGTMAWLQYSTRVRSEFTGTVAKCTEALQARVVKGAGSYTDWESVVSWGNILLGAKAKDAGRVGDELSPVTYPTTAALLDGQKDAALGTLYGHPVCGYEQYATGSYTWEKADKHDFMQFDLQFRVLDIDGASVAAGKEAMIATPLYLTDLTIAQVEAAGKTDVSKGLRMHIKSGTSYAFLAPGDGTAATVSTTTHGNLDLDKHGGNDTTIDVPSNYSFNTASPVALDYGKDMPSQKAYDLNKKMGTAESNGLYPVNDGKGKLSGGKALGTTVANASGTAFDDANYLTVTVTIWLEGWQQFTDGRTLKGAVADIAARDLLTPAAGDIYKVTDADDVEVGDQTKWYVFNGTTWDETTDPTATSALWDTNATVGAKFNIGLSFGVTTLSYTAYA